MHVGPSQCHPQWTSISLNDQAAFGAVLPAIRRVRSDKVPPKRALPIAPSALCQAQSTPPRSSQFSINTAQIRSKTPLSTHRCIVR